MRTRRGQPRDTGGRPGRDGAQMMEPEKKRDRGRSRQTDRQTRTHTHTPREDLQGREPRPTTAGLGAPSARRVSRGPASPAAASEDRRLGALGAGRPHSLGSGPQLRRAERAF